MPDPRHIITAQVKALVQGSFGCLDAAAETINARTGGSVNKGTLSKRLAGHAGWPVEEVWALEDAADRFPVSNLRARQLSDVAPTNGAPLPLLAASAAKESGEAIAAIIQAQASEKCGEHARAIAEIDEAIVALRAARSRLEA